MNGMCRNEAIGQNMLRFTYVVIGIALWVTAYRLASFAEVDTSSAAYMPLSPGDFNPLQSAL
jgi:hypothetical protein